MSTQHAQLESRVRDHIAKANLDPATVKLLGEVADVLAGSAPFDGDGPRADCAEKLRALIAAGLVHADAVGDSSFVEVVPDTNPEKVLAFGEPLEIINHLADHVGTAR